MQATAIGFFCHTQRMPTQDDMLRSYDLIESIFDKLGAKPTYFSADDGVGRGGYRKFGGAFHKRVLEYRTSGYRSVGLAANPMESDAPGFDNSLSINFAFGPEAGEVYATVTAIKDLLSVGTDDCKEVISQIAGLWEWDYGFGFERDACTMPGIYLSGGASDRQSPEDRRRGEKWYACYRPEDRQSRLRDIFQYNMVGIRHLSYVLPDGRNLRQFIENDIGQDALIPIGDLWLWEVESDRIEAVRAKLIGSGILISE